MKFAEQHPEEKARINALKSNHLLDTNAEVEFDNIAKIASQICGAPIALFSLVDLDRQFFKARVGLSKTETARDISFCSHAILEKDVFIVEDSRLDDRFKDNPLVTKDPNIVFYAGAPVQDPKTNLPIGTLCVIDHKPKILSDEQIESLRSLASQISIQLELRQKVKDLEIANLKLNYKSTAIETMTEGFVIQNSHGEITDYNRKALEILGLSADQLLGRTSADPNWQSIKANGQPFPGEEHPAMQCLKLGKPVLGTKMGIKSGSNEMRWISINASPIFGTESSTPTGAVATFTDITELQSAQETLVENARLVALAEMASGVAHEINNPLSIIVGSHSILSKTLDKLSIKNDDIDRHLGKIKDTTFRISKIVRGLQTFSRDASLEKNSDISFGEVLEDTLSICAERFKKAQVEIKIEIQERISLHANFIKLGQVLLNLLTNSFDAISNHPEKWIKISTSVENEITKIKFVDSGTGIQSEVVKKMFLPFYTTKPIGKGTGLGLSISKGVIEDMGGKFYYLPNQKNTTFIIELKTGQPLEVKKAS